MVCCVDSKLNATLRVGNGIDAVVTAGVATAVTVIALFIDGELLKRN